MRIHRFPARFPSARTAALAAVAAAALLGGCNLFDRTAPTSALYLLEPATHARREGPSLGVVTVRRFSAQQPFDGTAFVYRLRGGSWSIDPYDGFAAEPAAMLSGAARDAFEASGRFDAVVAEGVATRAGLSADGVLEAFYADFSGDEAPGRAGEAVVRLRLYLTSRADDGAVVFSSGVEGRAPIAERTPGAVASALSAASAAALANALDALPAALRSQKPG